MLRQALKKELELNYIKSYCEWMLYNRVKISVYLHLTDKEEVQNRKWSVKERGKVKETEERFELNLLVPFFNIVSIRYSLLMFVSERGKIERADFQKHSPKMM